MIDQHIFPAAQYTVKYSMYQNEWSSFELDFIYKYGEKNYKS
jgi:hypothetical protein